MSATVNLEGDGVLRWQEFKLKLREFENKARDYLDANV